MLKIGMNIFWPPWRRPIKIEKNKRQISRIDCGVYSFSKEKIDYHTFWTGLAQNLGQNLGHYVDVDHTEHQEVGHPCQNQKNLCLVENFFFFLELFLCSTIWAVYVHLCERKRCKKGREILRFWWYHEVRMITKSGKHASIIRSYKHAPPIAKTTKDRRACWNRPPSTVISRLRHFVTLRTTSHKYDKVIKYTLKIMKSLYHSSPTTNKCFTPLI